MSKQTDNPAGARTQEAIGKHPDGSYCYHADRCHLVQTKQPKTAGAGQNRDRARVWQESTGKWHYCDDAFNYLDARGTPYPTRKAAVKAAKERGYKEVA